MDYPAITICSQGLIQDVIDKALIKQFNDYLVNQGIDLNGITNEEKQKQKEAYSQSLYPGSKTSPDNMVKVLISDDPSNTIESSALTNPDFFETISQGTMSTTSSSPTTTSSSPTTTTFSTTTSTLSTTTSCGCVAPWFEPIETRNILNIIDETLPCYAMFDQTKSWEDVCDQNGGYTIFFTSENQGLEGLILQTLITEGIFHKM